GYRRGIGSGTSTRVQRARGWSIGGGGGGWNMRTSPAAIHSVGRMRYAVGFSVLSAVVSKMTSGVREGICRATPPPSGLLVVHASELPNRGHTNAIGGPAPGASPRRTPPHSDGRGRGGAFLGSDSRAFLSIFQYCRPPTVISSYWRTLIEPTSGLPSTMRSGTGLGGSVSSALAAAVRLRSSEDFGSLRASARPGRLGSRLRASFL